MYHFSWVSPSCEFIFDLNRKWKYFAKLWDERYRGTHSSPIVARRYIQGDEYVTVRTQSHRKYRGRLPPVLKAGSRYGRIPPPRSKGSSTIPPRVGWIHMRRFKGRLQFRAQSFLSFAWTAIHLRCYTAWKHDSGMIYWAAGSPSALLRRTFH